MNRALVGLTCSLSLAWFATACGTGSVVPGEGQAVDVTPSPTESDITATVEAAPSFPWVLPTGLETFAPADSAQAQAAVPFTSVVPSLPGDVTSLYVVPQDPPEFIVDYDMSGEAGLADHRVRLVETADDQTDSAFVASFVGRNIGPSVSVVTFAGTAAVVLSNGNLSRVEFVHSGVRFDLTGPAVPSDVSKDLASRIVQQLG